MGYSQWSDAAYQARQTFRKKSNQSAFTYDQHVRATGQRVVHDQMNPYRVTRESRDSDEHPTSVAIGVLFDVTGSMGTVPMVLQGKLGGLMRMLVEKGYVEHPQILFGGVGDAFTDAVPLQIGQFESGLEMDDDLGKLYLEGGGGGQVHESYELALYFFARHTSIDCYEKRGKRGYLFTIGDEQPYDMVRAEHVNRLMGDRLERDLPLGRILSELQERFEYFHIIPTNTFHGQSHQVQERWKALIGERLLLLDDESAVCETIALAIGLCEGTIDDLYQGSEDLVEAGHDRRAATTASSALARYATARPAVVSPMRGVLPAAPPLSRRRGLFRRR